MKKSILSIAALVTLLVISGSVNAQSSNDRHRISIDREAIMAKFCKRYPSARPCTQVHAVPEIDASSGTQALALVPGLGLLSAEGLRRRRRAIRTR